MNKHPLHVVSSEEHSPPPSPSSTSKRAETEARFDRIWLQTPQKLDSSRSALQKERIARTLKLLQHHRNPSGSLAVDLGCGNGYLTRQLRDLGAHVQAVDISGNALKELKKHDCTHIEPIQDYLPKSTLPDEGYDIVIAGDLIAYLDPKDYRLFFSELSRIVKKEGFIVFSTPIDIYSENALQTLIDYVTTEFVIDKWLLSHHALLIRLLDFFKAPERFAKARSDKNLRKRALEKRVSFNRWWFSINSSPLLGLVWSGIRHITNPIACFLENSPKIIKNLEKLSKWMGSENSISHIILIGTRKTILPPAIESMQPKEPKHKKQLWE